jgi:calcium-dependent protein kinase
MHRHLKPENLYMDCKNGNTIKVVDFGISKQIDPRRKNVYSGKIPTGSASYLAPEVLLSEYNEKCDVWSIGVMAFILLSGRPPFDGKDDAEIIKRVKAG